MRVAPTLAVGALTMVIASFAAAQDFRLHVDLWARCDCGRIFTRPSGSRRREHLVCGWCRSINCNTERFDRVWRKPSYG